MRLIQGLGLVLQTQATLLQVSLLLVGRFRDGPAPRWGYTFFLAILFSE